MKSEITNVSQDGKSFKGTVMKEFNKVIPLESICKSIGIDYVGC